MPRVLAVLLFVVGVTIAPGLLAVDTEEDPRAAALGPDYAAGKKAIEARGWNAAIKHFSAVAPRAPDNADVQNYLGYAYRNAGKLDAAFDHYQRALKLNPKHRGAHEYIGEAYLMQGNLTKAKEHLGQLDKLCFFGCEEYTDLKKAIAEFETKTKK